MSTNQFKGTAMQPQRNRKLCQFNKDQYCMILFRGPNPFDSSPERDVHVCQTACIRMRHRVTQLLSRPKLRVCFKTAYYISHTFYNSTGPY